MTRFRFVPCLVCNGARTVFVTIDGRPQPTGCFACGGTWNQEGLGCIGVTFEHSPEVSAALRAHSGKEQ